MALVATAFTVEIILLIFQVYFGFDSGFLRKLIAIGFGAIGISLVLQTQVYVSDLSSTPTNVFLFFTPSTQNALTLVFTLVTLTIMASIFVDLYKIIKEPENILEEIV